MRERVVIRPMTGADRPAMRESTQASFQDLEARLGVKPAPPAPAPQAPTSGTLIVGQLLRLDAPGAWIAELDGEVCGASMAGLRDGLWFLAHLHLRPGLQGMGVGRRLLDAALGHGPEAQGRILHSSLDPQAMRCYHRAGFALEPALRATGVVRRSVLPSGSGVREGGIDDLDLVADIDRVQRGAAHGPDFEVLVRAHARLLVRESGRKRGYALIDGGEPRTVAATDVPTAVALLWAALAESDGRTSVEVLRADQRWAIDVVHGAGLGLEATGPLCRQGDTGPLMPYLPHTGVL